MPSNVKDQPTNLVGEGLENIDEDEEIDLDNLNEDQRELLKSLLAKTNKKKKK